VIFIKALFLFKKMFGIEFAIFLYEILPVKLFLASNYTNRGMIMETIFGIFFLIICAFVWLIPLVAILLSSSTSGGEKVAWLLAVIFISWFAWIFYLLLAPLKGRRMRA
jgi:hypothetical protein